MFHCIFSNTPRVFLMLALFKAKKFYFKIVAHFLNYEYLNAELSVDNKIHLIWKIVIIKNLKIWSFIWTSIFLYENASWIKKKILHWHSCHASNVMQSTAHIFRPIKPYSQQRILGQNVGEFSWRACLVCLLCKILMCWETMHVVLYMY